MTPEEKAKELLNQFMKPVDNNHKYPMCYDTAKQCTLILVEEMLDDKEDALDVMFKGQDIALVLNSMQYWQQVKEAINQI